MLKRFLELFFLLKLALFYLVILTAYNRINGLVKHFLIRSKYYFFGIEFQEFPEKCNNWNFTLKNNEYNTTNILWKIKEKSHKRVDDEFGNCRIKVYNPKRHNICYRAASTFYRKWSQNKSQFRFFLSRWIFAVYRFFWLHLFSSFKYKHIFCWSRVGSISK